MPHWRIFSWNFTKRTTMLNIFWQTIKEKKWLISIYCLAGIIFLWLYVALFPSIQKSSASVTQLAKTLPQGLLKTFGLDAKSIITFEGFIAGKHYSLVWPILLIALVASLGSSFISGEIENGTIGVLLSQPISRIKIFLAKLATGIFEIILFVIFTVLSVFPLAKIYGVTINAQSNLKLTLVGFIFGLTILGLSMFFSAVFSERGKANFVVLGILIVMYFMNIIALLKDNLDKLKYFSFFYYFNYSEILNNNKFDYWSFWVFGGFFVVASLAALIWFNKRDIPI